MKKGFVNTVAIIAIVLIVIAINVGKDGKSVMGDFQKSGSSVQVN